MATNCQRTREKKSPPRPRFRRRLRMKKADHVLHTQGRQSLECLPLQRRLPHTDVSATTAPTPRSRILVITRRSRWRSVPHLSRLSQQHLHRRLLCGQVLVLGNRDNDPSLPTPPRHYLLEMVHLLGVRVDPTQVPTVLSHGVPQA